MPIDLIHPRPVDLMPRLNGALQRDLCLRWAPSGTQIDSAKEILKGRTPTARVYVPIALIGKERHFWTDDVEVRPVDGAWLAETDNDHYTAREAASRAAREAVGGTGIGSYAVIKHDGSWAVWEA